jgi:hypothetical protein
MPGGSVKCKLRVFVSLFDIVASVTCFVRFDVYIFFAKFNLENVR